MKIFIVRHGQDIDNADGILNGHRDEELTDMGRQQAQETALKLKDKNIQVICSSPLKRTRETAQIIAKELNIPDVFIYDDLIERDYGILTGKLLTDIAKYASKTLKTDRSFYFLEGSGVETFPILLVRAKKVLEEIKNAYPDKNILLVTHNDIGKMLEAAYLGWPWEKALEEPTFKNGEFVELS